MRTIAIALSVTLFAIATCAAPPQMQAQDAALSQALHARDAADTAALQSAIDAAAKQASQQPTADNYIRLALLEVWMCEAAHGRNDNKLVKSAAQAGVDAAEKAVGLNSNSSQAHELLGDLLGQLIPHVFAGGVRYGARSTGEIEKAIALDPRNADAYVARATSYYFTPAMFGGDKQKAVAMLQKAVGLAPDSDAADTAHIWLAMIYSEQDKHDDAVREAAEAVRLDPQRGFAQSVSSAIASGKKADLSN